MGKAYTAWELCEWITVIESANVSAWALDPYVILKSQIIQEGCPNGWATNEIGIKWLTRVSIPATNPRRLGFNVIQKGEFLEAYPAAYVQAFKASTFKKQVNKVKNQMGQGTENPPPPSPLPGRDWRKALIKCEFGMVNTMVMEKKYEDIFTANERERQKCKGSTRIKELDVLILGSSDLMQLEAVGVDNLK
ncbi:transposase [Histoplasma capsulatum var. duboisii H88]|uniref:Transposase n=1 Tax=Ajellomyces capsulatus (strain H88) TaxID=544711 RepID=F0UFI6_AJEC8|nr:transposase [Histoplasma capsulatum var. duboisii H88]